MRINKSLIAYTPTTGAGSGSVSSVALSAPTGFTVSGSPITTSGTLSLAFATGYGIPPLMTGNSGRFLTTNGTTMSWVNIAGTDITGAALTEVDDTNVTMTLGGNPSTALLRSVSMTLGWAGQLAVSRGGTGANNLNGVVIGNSTGPMTAVNGGPLQILRVNAGATGYEFFTLSSISGSGTTNYIPKWTSSSVLGDSQIIDNGTNVGIGVTPTYKLQVGVSSQYSGLNIGDALSVTSSTTAVNLLFGVNGSGVSQGALIQGREGTSLPFPIQLQPYGGNVGIGIVPTYKLHVNGSIGFNGIITGGSWNGNTITVPYGGTGAATLTGVVIGNGTSSMTAITGGPLQLLRVNASATGYEFFTSNFLTNPMTLNGDMIYQGGGVPVRLAANTSANNMFLRSVSSGNPSWETITGSDITGASLTKTDDTNVTLTLGGTPATSLLRSASLTLGWTGTLSVSRGGSGAATLSGVLIGNGTSAFTAITGGPNQILRVNAGATGYEFFTSSFLTNPMTLNYDMIYQSGGIPARLPSNITTTKQYLTSIGNGTATTSLAWASFTNADVPGDALTKVDDTNVTLTLGGTPATSVLRAVSLTMGWAGQLAVGRGGTGASTLTGVLIGNGTSAVTAVAGTAGQFLRRNTANTAYEFRTLQGGDIAGSELTKTDDTNVTLSLGGTPASSLLQPVSITLGWTGQLAVGRGGTGASTLTGVLIGNGTSAVTAVTGTASQLLRRNAANTAYEFFTASLITGNGVADRVAKWTSATNLIDSQIIDDGTNVGIGISPLYKFHVNGSGRFESVLYAAAPGAQLQIAGGGTTAGIYQAASSSILYISNWANSALGLQLNVSNGNLGLNVSPTYKLQVATSSEYTALNTGDGLAIYNPSLSGVNLILGVNGSGASQGALIQGKDGTGSTFAIQLQPYGGNVGISINPSWKLDVNGVIGLAGTAFAEKSGNNNVLYDGSGAAAIYLGGSTALVNSYENTSHSFKNRGASVEFATITSSGLNIKAGHLQLPSANYITWGGAYGANIPTIYGTSGTGSNLYFNPGGSAGNKMILANAGQLTLTSYTTATSFPTTPTGILCFNGAGSISTMAVPEVASSGTYTPTWTGLANVDSTTAYSCQYMRVGNTVTVSGYLNINATVDNTLTRVRFTLPINSAVAAVNFTNGTAAAETGYPTGCIYGSTTDTGILEVTPPVDTGINYSFHFTYRLA